MIEPEEFINIELTIGTEPTNDNRNCASLANHNQAKCSVPHTHALMYVQEDDRSDGGDDQHWEDEDVPPLVIIRGSGDDHTHHEGGSCGGDRVELGHGGAISGGSEDSGSEEGVGISGNDDSEVRETTEDDLEILDDIENIPPGRSSVELRISDIISEPGLDEGPLFVGQPPSFLREVWDEENYGNGAYNGRETL